MTSDLKWLLQDAAADAPSAHRLVADARAAAGRIQRRRRAFAAATAGVAVTTVSLSYRAGSPKAPDAIVAATSSTPVATASTPPSPRDTPNAPRPSGQRKAPGDPAALPDCQGGWSGYPRGIPPGRLAVRLLSSDPTFALESVVTQQYVVDCVRVPSALVLLDANRHGRVVRAVTVWGPRRTPVTYAHQTSGFSNIPVRGTVGRLNEGGVPTTNAIAWTEPSGASWEITGSGITKAELVGLTNKLAIDGGTVDVTVAGTAYRKTRRTGTPKASATIGEWLAVYTMPVGWMEVRATEGPALFGEDASVLSDIDAYHLTTVRGRPAVTYSSSGEVVRLSWQEAPGVQLSVGHLIRGGPGVDPRKYRDPKDLFTFAESLRLVAADDARVAAARHPCPTVAKQRAPFDPEKDLNCQPRA